MLFGTINLPFRSPKVGQRVAELVAYTRDTISPDCKPINR